MQILEYLTWCIYMCVRGCVRARARVCVCRLGIDLSWRVEGAANAPSPPIILAKNVLLLK